MEQRHPSSSSCRRQNGSGVSWTAAMLATALMVQHASAAVTGNGNTRSHHLQSRQYPSDAPGELAVCPKDLGDKTDNPSSLCSTVHQSKD